MIHQILIEHAEDGKSSFIDAGLPPFECKTVEEALAEVERLQAENGRCYAAQLIDEQPAQ